MPAIPKFKFGGSFMTGDGGAEDVEKTAFVPTKKNKKGSYLAVGRRSVFCTWAQFRDAMVQRFEPVIEVEEA